MKVIPVCHKGMTPAALPEPIRRLQAVDINAPTEAEQLRKLAEVVRQVADLPAPSPIPAEALPPGGSKSTVTSLRGWFVRPVGHVDEEFTGMFRLGNIASSDTARAEKAGLDPTDTIFVRLFQEPPTGQFLNCLAQGKVASLLERDDMEGGVIEGKLKLVSAFDSGPPDHKMVPLIVLQSARKRQG